MTMVRKRASVSSVVSYDQSGLYRALITTGRETINISRTSYYNLIDNSVGIHYTRANIHQHALQREVIT